MKLEGRKCVVCSAYLFEDDDVVICPECGAPHHRDCWGLVGKCKLGEFHGTENQYKYEPEEEEAEEETKTEEKASFICRGCGAELPSDSNFCPYCNMPVHEDAPNIQFAAPVSYRFDPNEELEDGVTVGEAAKVVAVNGFRYIPKFKEFKKGKKTSWNWSAFIWPYGWYAFRKMYLLAALLGVIVVAGALFASPLNRALADYPSAVNYYEMMSIMGDIFESSGPIPLIFAAIGGAINIGIRVFAAIFADYSYKNRVITACKEIREAEDKETALRKKSGISFLAFGIALVAETLVEVIIAAFI